MLAFAPHQERKLRRLGIQRPANASIRDLLLMLQRRYPDGGGEMSQLLRDYEQLRYRPPLPDAAAVRDFEQRVRRLARQSTPS